MYCISGNCTTEYLIRHSLGGVSFVAVTKTSVSAPVIVVVLRSIPSCLPLLQHAAPQRRYPYQDEMKSLVIKPTALSWRARDATHTPLTLLFSVSNQLPSSLVTWLLGNRTIMSHTFSFSSSQCVLLPLRLVRPLPGAGRGH